MVDIEAGPFVTDSAAMGEDTLQHLAVVVVANKLGPVVVAVDGHISTFGRVGPN